MGEDNLIHLLQPPCKYSFWHHLWGIPISKTKQSKTKQNMMVLIVLTGNYWQCRTQNCKKSKLKCQTCKKKKKSILKNKKWLKKLIDKRKKEVVVKSGHCWIQQNHISFFFFFPIYSTPGTCQGIKIMKIQNKFNVGLLLLLLPFLTPLCSFLSFSLK